MPIPIDIAGRNRGNAGHRTYRPKNTSPIIPQQAQAAVDLIEHREIRCAILIEIRRYQVHRTAAHSESSCREEPSMPVAQQYGHVIGRKIGASQVGDAIAIKIGRHQSAGRISGRNGHRGLKTAVALTVQN